MALVGLPYVTWFMFWVISPAVLIASCIFRYNGLSAMYFLLLVTFPYSPRLKLKFIPSWLRYTRTVLLVSAVFLVGHCGFQIALVVVSPYGSITSPSCSWAELTASYVGFHSYRNVDPIDVFRLIFPDVAVFTVSLLTYILTKKTQVELRESEVDDEDLNQKEIRKKFAFEHLKNSFILCINILLMALAGIAYPNVVSAIYLLVFMVLVTMWSFRFHTLTVAVTLLRAVLSAVTALQLLTYYIYQIGYFQRPDVMPPDSIITRLFGLKAIIRSECEPGKHKFHLMLHDNVGWTVYVGLLLIFFLHWSMAVGVRIFFRDYLALLKKHGYTINTLPSLYFINRSITDADRTPLIAEDELARNYGAMTSESRRVTGETADPLPGPIQPSTSRTSPPAHYAAPADDIGLGKRILLQLDAWFTDIKKYSFYMVALIVMMFWSVTYHSWLTFILLLMSCVLWMSTKRQQYTLFLSPFITFYSMALVLLQYVYSLPLKESELPTQVNLSSGTILYLATFGIRRFDTPIFDLGLQVLYTFGFWLVLHQHNYLKKFPEQPSEVKDEYMRTLTERWATWAHQFMCKYWIFVVFGVHLFIATNSYPSGIKIIYLIFFLLQSTAFTLSWEFWRKTLHFYFTVLVTYTMIVLILIYTYQFPHFLDFWQRMTGFTNEQLADLGLVKAQAPAELIDEMMPPAIFLLVVIFQLNYFNAEFLESTDLDRRRSQMLAGTVITVEAEPQQQQQRESSRHSSGLSTPGGNAIPMSELSSRPHDRLFSFSEEPLWMTAKLSNVAAYVVRKLDDFFTGFFLNVLEIYATKVLFLIVFYAATRSHKSVGRTDGVKSVNSGTAIYLMIVCLWSVLLPAKRFHRMLFVTTMLGASFVLVAGSVYQLDFVQDVDTLSFNCTIDTYAHTKLYVESLLDWIGISKIDRATSSFAYAYQGLLQIIICIMLERTVKLHVWWRRAYAGVEAPPVLTLFPDVTWKQMDVSFVKCLKFLMNFFFYKFGLEMCHVMSIITIMSRMDAFAVVYCALLICSMVIKTRKTLYTFFRVYLIILISLLILQYVNSTGLPPFWCVDRNYYWGEFTRNEKFRNRFVRYFYLPDYVIMPNPGVLLVDFLQLMLVVSQLSVFKLEGTRDGMMYGGDNYHLAGPELDQVTMSINPRKNFTRKKSRSLLDHAKVLVFQYQIWFSMMVVFLAGAVRISLFCLGYLLSFFYLLQRNQSLLIGSVQNLLRKWNYMIGYCMSVIVVKVLLQVVSCVYLGPEENSICPLIQLLTLACDKAGDYGIEHTSLCGVKYSNSGLELDLVCFIFLLLQRRIFSSFYFLHARQDMIISLQLASRGAELYEANLIENVRQREKEEERCLKDIKASMQRIRNRRKTYNIIRYGGAEAKELDHISAMRAGGYFMFEDEDDDYEHDMTAGTELKPSKPSTVDASEPVTPDGTPIMTPYQMLQKAHLFGIDEALMQRTRDKRALSECIPATIEEEDDNEDSDIGSEQVFEDADTEAARNVEHGKRAPGSPKHVKRRKSRSLMNVAGERGRSSSSNYRVQDEEPCTSSSQQQQEEHHIAFADDTPPDAESGSETNEDDMSKETQVDDEEELAPPDSTWFARAQSLLSELFLACVDFIVLKLNAINYNYRNIRLQLNSEKDVLTRQQILYEVAVQQQEERRPTVGELPTRSSDRNGRTALTNFDVDLHFESSAYRRLMNKKSLRVSTNFKKLNTIDFDKDQPRPIKLFYAVWYFTIARSDRVCYFLMILNLMLNASLMSLVLPLTVYFWANFSIPRPTKAFWMFAMLYLEAVVAVKFLFQFDLFPWNSEESKNLNTNNPFWWPRFIGIEQWYWWMVMDLMQLLATVFHVSVMKTLGLWDSANDEVEVAEQPEPIRTSHRLTLEELSPPQEIGAEEEHAAEIEHGRVEEAPSGTIVSAEELSRTHLHSSSPAEESTATIHTTYQSELDMGELQGPPAGDTDPDDTATLPPPGLAKARSSKMKLIDSVYDIARAPVDLYSNVLHQRFTSAQDVYIFMILCDIINIIITCFGYWAFGQYSTGGSGQTDVFSNIRSNRVPTGFLIMLLIQLLLVFIDRALYLRKNLLGKMMFHALQLIAVHIWMFFVLPYINDRPFYQNSVAQSWYFFKALYFLLSAYQIRVGYPTIINKNFLTKKPGTINLFLFKVYRIIPFLEEMTCTMNWMFSETSMLVSEWTRLWNIHADIFETKCWRIFEEEYPMLRSQPREKWIKNLQGGIIVLLCVVVIWFPLLWMNLVSTLAGVSNNPTQVEIRISLSTFEPLLQLSSDISSIQTLSYHQFEDLKNKFALNQNAAIFVDRFSKEDLVTVRLEGESKTKWIISPPQRALMVKRLAANNTQPIKLTNKWTVYRETKNPAQGGVEIVLQPDNPIRKGLYELLNGGTATFVKVTDIMPKYIYAAENTADTPQALKNDAAQAGDAMTSLNLMLQTEDARTSWWEAMTSGDAKGDHSSFQVIVFSDKVAPESLNFITSIGIFGLYTTFVLVIGRIMRGIIFPSTTTIAFSEMPNVDRILQLCNDIFLVRELQEFELEEDLYAKLIFLYRSPQTLIKWSKAKTD